ncbi:hypothetical protein EP56_05565 [Listeriaceae bacterium FSL A5-0209]|nr:hypothetical protein EP56_05565 [Listeriaceae bacterium FSL A5-0209]
MITIDDIKVGDIVQTKNRTVAMGGIIVRPHKKLKVASVRENFIKVSTNPRTLSASIWEIPITSVRILEQK